MKPTLWVSKNTTNIIVMLAEAKNESNEYEEMFIYCDSDTIEKKIYCANRQWFLENYRIYHGI